MSEPQTQHEWPEELVLDDEAGPAPYITRARADALILGALDRASGASTGPRAVSRVGPGMKRQSPRPDKPGIGARSLAAAVLLACISLGSASAAVMWYARREPTAPLAEPSTRERSRVLEPAAQKSVTVLAPALDARPVGQPERQDKSAVRAPEDWLVEGNELRAARQWSKADHAYGRAAQQAPHSQTAYVARVAAAAVRLEHLHDPRGALARYRAALAQSPRGSLSEEIRLGIADSLRAIGNRAAEREALLELVREHPSSPLVEQARARLD